jgi:hypothetical protein
MIYLSFNLLINLLSLFKDIFRNFFFLGFFFMAYLLAIYLNIDGLSFLIFIILLGALVVYIS